MSRSSRPKLRTDHAIPASAEHREFSARLREATADPPQEISGTKRGGDDPPPPREIGIKRGG